MSTPAAESVTVPTIEDVRDAAARIAPYAHRTPVLTSSTFDRMTGRSLFFKCELFQKVGAFKFRGAANAVFKLDDAAAARGVCAHSSGNHAQALALAAKMRGIPAHIVMPRGSNATKIAAVREYGATIYESEPHTAGREGLAAEVCEKTGAVLIPPYDHFDIIAGQGTATLELLEDHPDLDCVVPSVGGGGLTAGTCIAAAAHAKTPKVVGAEPSGADDAARSLACGERLPQDAPDTICDGLRTGLGVRNWRIISTHIDRIITVDDDEVARVMRLMWERMNILVEPSAAITLAAVMSDEFPREYERVGLILTGGNVDLSNLPW